MVLSKILCISLGQTLKTTQNNYNTHYSPPITSETKHEPLKTKQHNNQKTKFFYSFYLHLD